MKRLPTIMRKLRETESQVKSLLRMILSMKTLKKGDVKLRTIRSPIGKIGTAMRNAKLVVEIAIP